MTPPLINDNEAINAIARAAAVKLFGEEGCRQPAHDDGQ